MKHTNLPLHEFHRGMNLILNNTFFVYNNDYYSQIDGIRMGSCLCPFVADLVMNLLLDEVISRLPFTLPLLKKYVDDLLTTVPMNMVDQTLAIFNSYCPSL